MEHRRLDPARFDDVVLEVVDELRLGRVVLVPTDTIYGLAASLEHVERLVALKGRPQGKPIAVLVADPEQGLDLLADGRGAARSVAVGAWPGALTIVAAAGSSAPARLVAADGTIGVRCPDDAFVRAVARRLGPIAVTSANRSGDAPIGAPAEVAELWLDPEVLTLSVDAGERGGAASTVVRLADDGPELLREGPIDIETVRGFLR